MTAFFKILIAGLSVLVGVFILELVASRIITTEAFNPQINISDEALAFYKDQLKDLHHLRNLDDERWKLNKKPSNALYTEITPFKEGRDNLLIQGDSWAEQFSKPVSLAELEKFSSLKQVGLVNAGTTSYSPSVMTVQLRKLRELFDIRPTHVIAIVDQTDIGDELCRYSPRRRFDASGRLVGLSPEPFNSGETYELDTFFQKQAILRTDASSLGRLFRSAALQARYHLSKENRRCGWATITRPLEHGLSETEADEFKSSLRKYIHEVFTDNHVTYLLFVTHPHRRNLPSAGSDQYVAYTGDLIRETVAANSHHNRIGLLDFMRSDFNSHLDGSLDDVFRPGDRASHLTDQVHGSVFAPSILGEIEPQL